jgi:predicted nuclease of predicted toxin-antitoxin system
VKFIVDAQLPERLSAWLRTHGHDSIHTLDLSQANRTPDDDVRELADRELRVVVTKDSDFVDSHLLRNSPEKLLLIATGNISNDLLLALFSTHHHQIIEALEQSGFVQLSTCQVIIHG